MPKIIPKNRAMRRATRPCAAHGRTSARLSDNSNMAQPFPQPSTNRFPTPHKPSETSTPSTTVLQPLVGLGHAKPSSNPPTTTLQPSFVSNPRSTRSRHNHPTSCPKTVQQSSPYTLCPDPRNSAVPFLLSRTLLNLIHLLTGADLTFNDCVSVNRMNA